MTVKMIVSDLDGTILRKDKTISPFTAAVLRAAKEAGILFAVATARPVRGVVTMLPFLSFDAGIFHNGAVIRDADGKETSIGIGHPTEITDRLIPAFPDRGICIEAEDVLYANFDPRRIWGELPYVFTEDFREVREKTADKLIVEASSEEALAPLIPYLREDLYIELSENTIAMIMNRRATKADAVRYLCASCGILPKETVAFGDDRNDREMLRLSGTGVAVRNAEEAVRACADEICGTNEEDGPARWLLAHVPAIREAYERKRT